jgi:hypothetical protein
LQLKPSLLIGASNISVLAVRIKIRQAVRVVTSRIYSSKYSMAEKRFALVFWIEDEHLGGQSRRKKTQNLFSQIGSKQPF